MSLGRAVGDRAVVLVELVNQLPAQAVERGEGNVAIALELIVYGAQFVNRVTEAAELSGKGVCIE